MQSEDATEVVCKAKFFSAKFGPIFAKISRVGWKERCWAIRLAMAGSALGAIAFGEEDAAIAVVLGAAGLFAGVFLDDLRRPDSRRVH